MFNMRCGIAILAGLFLAYTPFCSAQTAKAQITGLVRDSTGAVVPDAELRVLHVETGTQRVIHTNNEGAYSAPLLDPGNYRVSVQKHGFRSLQQSNIRLEVAQVARIDFTLEIGAVTETVEVTAAAPQVDPGTAAMGTVVSSRQIVDLPLNSRNPFRLMFIAPGVVPSNSFGDYYSNAANFSVSGGSPGLNQIYIDGTTNSVPEANQGANDPSLLPSPDALAEFKVQTNSYPAEYGRGTGIINMVIKSGTNEFHGSIYEFLRNSKMDSNNFFANRAGTRLTSFKRNQFGVTAGGPIVHDKAFFFVNYEGLRQGTQSNMTATVPTALERQGNYSQSRQLLAGNCQPVQIYDPVSTRPNPGGSGYLRDMFSNSVIPPSRLDKVGSAIIAFYPLPNQPGAACSGANNFFSSRLASLATDQGDAKLDWFLTGKDRLSWGGSWRRRDEYLPNFYDNYAAPGYGLVGDANPVKGTRLDYTRMHSSALVLNFRFGVNRLWRITPPPTPEDFQQASLGFPAFLDAQMRKPVAFPIIRPSDGGSFGPNWDYVFWSSTVYSWHGSAMWVKGSHTFKFGIEARVNQVFEDTGLSTSGNYTFDRGFTQGPNPNTPSPIAGNGVASLLLGLGNGVVNWMPSVLMSNHYFGLYAQDDFKVTSRLTLNLGLRYDLEPGRSERFNQLSWFNFTGASPLAARVGLPDLKGGLEFAGVKGNPASQFNTSWRNFGPRFGLAYSVNPKTVLRLGYGLVYLPFIGAADGQSSGLTGFSSVTQWVSSLDGVTPLNFLSNPHPNGLTPPTGSSLGLATAVGQALSGGDARAGAVDRGSKVDYLQQWNVNIQRELLPRLSAEIAYVGSKGTHLTDTWDLNQLHPQYLSLGSSLQALVPNPFYGVIRTGALSGPNVARGQLLRPYPQFLDVYYWRNADASSVYHSLQVRVERRFTDGSTILGSYTNGKSLDDAAGTWGGNSPGHQSSYNRRADRSLSGFDVSQRLVVSGVYALPFGRNRWLGAGWSRWADAVFGNWHANAIATFSKGIGLAVTAPNSCNCYMAFNPQRPNVAGDPTLPGGRSTSEKLAKWFNTSVFRQPVPFSFGNSPRLLPNVRSDGIKNIDFSLFKEFPFGEKHRVEFRAEAFNFFNTPQFALPALGINSALFGAVSAQQNIPRQIQLGLKLFF